MNATKKTKGFTIIEVVLVLAIAGLIFLMVFIALPALQRSQRDTQRKDDLSRATTAITNYTSNNHGMLPTGPSGWALFETQYLATNGDTFVDPSGPPSSGQGQTTANPPLYVFQPNNSDLSTTSFTAAQNVIYYAVGDTCGSNGTVTQSSTRKVAFRMVLEGGGVYCQNN